MGIDYEFHPIADIFPLMSELELVELAADILANGLRVPIVLFRGRILDGRNRYAACYKVSVEPTFNEYAGSDSVRYSLSLNLHRRHLSASQKAAVGANIANLRHGGDRRSDQAASWRLETPITQAQAAELVGSSERSIARAVAVKKADPEVHEQVLAGTKTLPEATRAMKEVAERSNQRLQAILEPQSESTGEKEAQPPTEEVQPVPEEPATTIRFNPFNDAPSIPTTDEERCVRRFKTFVKDLAQQFEKDRAEIRSYIWRYLDGTH